jgi:hypothetical protein
MIFCFACKENDPDEEPVTTPTTTASPVTSMAPRPDTGIYSIRLSDTITLSLQQWDSTIDLQKLLGKPVKQISRKLDRNSDTFAGSFIKDLEYDGLKLQLFSPPQNGKTYWVHEIILTNNKYTTSRKVRVGDEIQKVNQAYPSIQKFPGVNKNMYYVADAGYERSIELEFENNRLKKLRMYYMLN